MRRAALVALPLVLLACRGDRGVAVTPPPKHIPAVVTIAAAQEETAPPAPHVPSFPDAALIDSEVDRTRDALLAERDQRTRLAGARVVRWDKKTPPRYLDRVVERLGLTDVVTTWRPLVPDRS